MRILSSPVWTSRSTVISQRRFWLMQAFGYGIMLMAILFQVVVAQVAEREVAELRFDRRFENAATASAASLPAWITGVDQKGGSFYDEPASWQVPATVADGSGRLNIYLDRTKLAGDLAATFLFSAEQATDFAVQLFDAQGRVVVVDLFGNLVEISAAFSTNTFVIPLTKYPTATKIVIRHIHGAVAIFGAVLYPVATEGPMVDAEVMKLARKLGDPLSPENPILKNLKSIAMASPSPAPVVPAVSISSQPLKQPLAPPITLSACKALTTAINTGCLCGTKRTASGGPPTLKDPPALPAIKPFKHALNVLVEDSHGGSDIYNEYNFGSAQLARVLTAQGAKVVSSRNAKGFNLSKGLTRELLDSYAIVIFNGRFSGRNAPFRESEIVAVRDWVNAGGGLLVTCSSPTAGDHLDAHYFNPLLKPFGLYFGWENLDGSYQAPTSKTPHPILSGIPDFVVSHGITVIGSAPAEDVAHVGNETAMLALHDGKGRVIAFGAGSALQNQTLNSRIIGYSSSRVVNANTQLLMNLSLWLSGSDSL